MIDFKYRDKKISGVEFLIFLMLQMCFKIVVVLGAFYLLNWVLGDIELKTLVFLICAGAIGWNSKLTFRGDMEECDDCKGTGDIEVVDDVYCPVCGTCGEEGCCDPLYSIEKHLKTKTDCLYNEQILRDISFGYTLGLEIYDEVSENCKDLDTKCAIEKISDKWWNYYYKGGEQKCSK